MMAKARVLTTAVPAYETIGDHNYLCHELSGRREDAEVGRRMRLHWYWGARPGLDWWIMVGTCHGYGHSEAVRESVKVTKNERSDVRVARISLVVPDILCAQLHFECLASMSYCGSEFLV